MSTSSHCAGSAPHTVSAIVAAVVADHTREVFALMGNGNAYFTDALVIQDRVRVTALRHEAGTVASADAYHRVSRSIACATTTYGPGYTNALTTLAEAACSRTPLVYVVGSAPSSGLRPWDVDQAALAEAVGAIAMTVDPQDPAGSTREAFAAAHNERRPVVLNIPYDYAQTLVPEGGSCCLTRGHQAKLSHAVDRLQPDELKKVVQALTGSDRPLILAGRGAREAAQDLGVLADRVGALTVSSAPARGIFGGRSWDLGVCGGFASEASSSLIKQADLVLAVGASLNQFTTAFGHQFAGASTVIQVDILDQPSAPCVTDFVQSDAAGFVRALLQALPEKLPGERWGGIAGAARGSRLTFTREVGAGQAEDGRLDPRTAMVKLNEILPMNRQVISDGGHFIGWSSYYFDLPGPDSLTLVGTQFQSIGLGLPSAPGAIIASPDATHVIVTGDGGGIMGLPDLDSVVRTSQSAAVIVFNDGCYGAEIHQYGSQGLDMEIMEIDEADFVSLGRGFGAKGVIVQTLKDLDTVSEWVAEGAQGTIVIDLRISRNIVAPYIEEIIEMTLKK